MQIVKHKAFKYIESVGGVSECLHKKNGLRVLIWEEHSAPVVALNVTYLVGSRNEAVGHTGATHLLEHLMFKASKKYNKKTGKEIDKIVFGMGAQSNATTWFDRTNYYELAPADQLPLLLDLEADRMRGAILTEADRASEMTVVRNEFERGENSTQEVLDKEVWATAFREHPYHHPTIGWRSDVENMSIEKLRQFYNTYYWPNNAYVTVAGDIDTSSVLKLIDTKFGKIKTSPLDIPVMYTTEPRQQGPRRVIVSRAGEPGIVQVSHKIGPWLHKDNYALGVLAGILGKGRAGRLTKRLVDTGLATNVSVGDYAFRDGGLFTTSVDLVPGVSHTDVEQMILDEYKKIIETGVDTIELEREKYSAKVASVFSKDGPLGLAGVINECIAMGDWRQALSFVKRVEAVTLEDVAKVAGEYLTSEASTTGYFICKN